MLSILYVIVCHLIGDYVLQCDFIAKSKGDNLYHMFVHCFLYCIPFAVVFGMDWKIVTIFLTHILIDLLKARWKKINYVQDQIFHYIIGLIFFTLMGG